MPGNPTAKELAEEYCYAYSFLKSDKSLWGIFLKAVKGSWTAEKFAAEVKTSSWYKKNSETTRAYDYLKSTDKATFMAQRQQMAAQIKDKAASLGANISGATLNRIADNAMKFGWNDSQLQDTLSQYVKVSHGIYKGSVGNDIESVKAAAYKNGITLSAATVQSWAHNIAAGNTTAETYARQVRQMAKSLAPGYAKELDAGVDLQDIVSPYIEAKAKILEKNPADIDLFDKDIRSAVSGTTKDGKPSSKSLWQFENDMRAKPEWLQTQNAQDSVMSTARKVLTDFGFQGV
jgi:hypothetical protein